MALLQVGLGQAYAHGQHGTALDARALHPVGCGRLTFFVQHMLDGRGGGTGQSGGGSDDDALEEQHDANWREARAGRIVTRQEAMGMMGCGTIL